jgi:hypothetical protein
VEFDKIQLLRLNFPKGLPIPNGTAAQIEFSAFKRRKSRPISAAAPSPVMPGCCYYGALTGS